MEPVSELLNLSGKTAVVTGGAMGIGQGITERLHEAGANIVIADLDDGAAQELATKLNSLRQDSCIAVCVDVSRTSEVQNLVSKAINKFNSIDILVNNAGIYPSQPLATMTDESFKKVLDVNLYGTFLCLKYVSEQMIGQGGGKIINITSIDALHPSMVGLAHYDASKHGLWGLTKNAALELAKHNISVNAVAPGGIATPGVSQMQSANQTASAEQLQKQTAAFMAKIPMNRMGEPDDIGKVVLFVASGMSSYMTGSQIVVDGGALLT